MNRTSIVSVDIFKFVLSLFVVSIHTEFAKDITNPVFKEIWILLCNSAVPFFLAVSGYLMYDSVLHKDISRINHQIKKVFLLYVIWSVLYLPINIYGEIVKYGHTDTWHINIIKGWIFTGENYGSWILWYLLAFLVALLLIRFLINKMSVESIIMLSLLLYLVGGVYSMFHDSFQLFYYDHTFRTTRNGFFTGLTLLCSGFLVARYKSPNVFLLILSLCLLYWGDKYIRFLFCGYIFLSVALHFKIKFEYSVLIRKCSTLIYFTHMLFVFLYKDILEYNYGLKLFVLSSISSLGLSLLIIICSTHIKQMRFLKLFT